MEFNERSKGLKSDTLKEIGKAFMTFTNILVIMIFFKAFYEQGDNIFLIYGLSVFIILYTVSIQIMDLGCERAFKEQDEEREREESRRFNNVFRH